MVRKHDEKFFTGEHNAVCFRKLTILHSGNLHDVVLHTESVKLKMNVYTVSPIPINFDDPANITSLSLINRSKT